MQLSFFGKNYHGWQIQPNARSVQETLNHVFSTILDEEVYLLGAGRTDTGVHAREMWAHFDYPYTLPVNFVNKVNRFIDRDIAIQSITEVRKDAHVRFDAVSREYEYHISLTKDPFETDLSWYVFFDVDVQKMQEAAGHLLKYEDFTSFSRTNTQTKTNNCNITRAEWKQEGNKLIFTIMADRFLRNMVRAIVGTLIEVGNGKRSEADFVATIKGKDRRLAGESAPARGLFLTRVQYPQEIFNGK